MSLTRCEWGMSSPLTESYHDTEWGVPLHDDWMLFEFIVLEGAQAGDHIVTCFRHPELAAC